jgi:hypothetical protein
MVEAVEGVNSNFDKETQRKIKAGKRTKDFALAGK